MRDATSGSEPLYRRLCAERVEGYRLYAHTIEDEPVTYVVSLDRHRYLASLVTSGDSFNVVDYRDEHGVLVPTLIVLDPDYLVDVTAIASCCEPYSHSHLTSLLNRLKPVVHTEAIMLGHLAGQLLDEEVHDMYESPYRDSVQRFFKRHVLGLLATDISADFHEKAQTQKFNIHRAISEELPRCIPSYRAEEVILEPSFISEMLGLQGRMDFLQMDYSVLIEQKAGRCGWPQQHPEYPVEQMKHYMQMMLYWGVITYNYRQHLQCDVRTFLLYSKYAHPLLPLSASVELLCEAMEIRNRMVCAEKSYACGGLTLLDELHAEDLNTRILTNVLWTRYQKPQIEQILLPLHRIDALEKAYYYRFMTFVAAEHRMAKVGDVAGDHGYASKWHDSLEEKYEKGDICDRMQLVMPNTSHQGVVEYVELDLKTEDNMQMCNFRVGDIVVLYPYDQGSIPDVRKSIVFRSTIVSIDSSHIVLALRAPQSDARVFLRDKGKAWALEHDFMDSSFASQYRAMHAYLSMSKKRKDLLLLRRAPRTDADVQLTGSYGAFDPLVLRAKQARELFLIIGPPGTGKTSFGLMSVLREELVSDVSSSVLLLAYTNRAVDEICSKLVEYELPFLRIGSPHSCPSAFRPYLLDTLVDESPSLAHVRQRIVSSRIVVCTTTAINAHVEIFALKSFTLAIVDEASQILEPHLLGVMAAMHQGHEAVGRFVLIGDHKQLPAVVKQSTEQSQVCDPLLHEALLTDCRQSLFERLLKRYRNHSGVTYMLNCQGRMHRDIARFPNEAFYGNTLYEATDVQREPLTCSSNCDTRSFSQLFVHRVAFVEAPPVSGTLVDKVNIDEAAIIASMVYETYLRNVNCFEPSLTVGVIVPYRNQIAAIRYALETYGIPLLTDITIDTVERFQGSQRDVIIYGFTVKTLSQLDFLTDNVFEEEGVVIDRKLNVVMTRARSHLFMVGNPDLLATNRLFARLIDYVRASGGYIDKL